MPHYQIVRTCHIVADGRAVTHKPGTVVELSREAAAYLGARVKPVPRPKPVVEQREIQSPGTEKGQP